MDINYYFSQIDTNQDGYLTFEEVYQSFNYLQENNEFIHFIENVLLILDELNTYQINLIQYQKVYQIIQQALVIKQHQKQNENNQIEFPETEKLRLYFQSFEKRTSTTTKTTDQIMNWIRKINNIEMRLFMETSLRGMNSNHCDETMFINCFITPDAYIREYCPKYINLFNEIDLNKNGKIDIQEIMYHISTLFQCPENMREFFTTVIKLLDSDGDNELNLVEFVKYCISLNKLFDLANGNYEYYR